MFMILTCAEQFSANESDHCVWPSLHDNEDSDVPLPLEAYAILLGWPNWGGSRSDNEPYQQGTMP